MSPIRTAVPIAYRFGWMKSPDGGIYDAKCKHKIAADFNNLLYMMDAKEWIRGSGPASRIEWDLVKLQESETAAARLLS